MKKMIIFALIMAISVATPIQAMAESVTQSDVEMQPSEQNIEQIIDEITSEPHPINSDAIQNVKEYIIQYWGDLGYDEIECQKFEYNDENNENAIRRFLTGRCISGTNGRKCKLLTALVKILL